MTLSEDSEKNEKQRMDLFYSFLKQRSDAGDVEGSKAINEILHEADRYLYYSFNHLFMLCFSLFSASFIFFYTIRIGNVMIRSAVW